VFTGIIQEIGTVAAIEELGNGRQLTIACTGVLPSLGLGDSVSVDGACQTVTALLPDAFQVQTIATTLERTILGDYRPGRQVNLELALAMGDRLGGHLVQGHVDGVGTVTRVEPHEELVLIECTMPPIVADVTILHGSITVNGVSLTVNALPERERVELSIIPFTLSHTTFGALRERDRVNLEGDLIGKYVRQMMRQGWSRDERSQGETDLLGLTGYSTTDSGDR
jgi:riboflavin synthase